MAPRRSLDMDVPLRQCFGGMFEKTSRDQQTTREILSGTLRISPHPSWAMPKALSWDENPFDQRNWRAQLHMLRWLEPIRRAAAQGDEGARRYWLETVRSWVRSNPPNRSKGDFAWADMVDGVRALCLVFGLPLTQDDSGWLLDSITEHGEWLADASHVGRANHALHQHQALFVISRLLRNHEWQDLAVTRLENLFAEAYDDEGVNNEGSLGYHKNNAIWWQTAARRLALENIPSEEINARLRLALSALVHASRPDGKLELIGDTELTTLAPLSSPEIDYVRSQGSSGQPPADLAKVYRRGYAFGRSGWGEFERDFADELFYSLSFGRADRIHGHADGSSLTLHANGQPWLIDAGKYAYKTDPMRRYCLSRMAHNVMVLDDLEYNKSSEVKLESHWHAPDADEYIITDNGYEGVELTRNVLYSRAGDFIVVADTVRSTIGPVRAHQRWHLDSETIVDAISDGFRLRRGHDSMHVTWPDQEPRTEVICGKTDPFDGWHSTIWMEKTAAPVLQASKNGTEMRFVAVIAVNKKEASFASEGLHLEGDAARLTITNGRNKYSVRLNFAGCSTVLLGERAGADETTLSRVQAKVQSALGGAVRPPALNWGGERFTRQHWLDCVRWIQEHSEPKLARLQVLQAFLEMLSTERNPNDMDDQGLRAAAIDIAGEDISSAVGLSASTLQVLRDPLVQWPEAPPLTSRTYHAPIATITDRSELPTPGASPNIVSAMVGGLVLPIASRRGTSDVLTVRFHGAVNRTRSTLPLFQGMSSASRGPDSFMIFQDPSLDLNRSMNLSWFLGERDVDLFSACASYIKELQSRVQAKHVILTGSSGGGFAALQVARFLPDCKVLVFNPQTDIRRYFRSVAETAVSTCFRSTVADLEQDLVTRASVVSSYQGLSMPPKVLYVQNTGDAHHMENHRNPFEAMLKAAHPKRPGRVRFIDEDWGPGHIPASPDNYARYHAMAVSGEAWA